MARTSAAWSVKPNLVSAIADPLPGAGTAQHATSAARLPLGRPRMPASAGTVDSRARMRGSCCAVKGPSPLNSDLSEASVATNSANSISPACSAAPSSMIASTIAVVRRGSSLQSFESG